MMDGKRRDPYLEDKRLKKINRQIRMRSWKHRTKRRLLLPFIRFMKPKDIVWADGYGGKYPACPRCGEYVYYDDMCCFCGQRLANSTTVGRVMESHER